MKKLVSIIVLFAILLQAFVNVGIGIYYHINKTYIVNKLCENKNKPGMHCNGHCYLAKQLKKAEDKESKSAQSLKEKEEIICTRITGIKLKYDLGAQISLLRPVNSAYLSSENIFPLLKPPVPFFA